MLCNNGNARDWASVCPDAPLLSHDASPTTHAHSFLKKTAHPLIHIHSFLFLSLLSAHLPLPSAQPLVLRGSATSEAHHSGAGLARHNARLPALSGVTALSKSRGRGLPVARVTGASLPRRAATAAGPPPTSVAGPLHPVNTTYRRSSILSSNKEILH
jgi:hypothetical protein